MSPCSGVQEVGVSSFIRCLFLVVVCSTWMCTTPTSACAHGLGVNIAGATGDHLHRAVGFTWDTSVAQNKPLNYRMNLDYETFKLDEDWGGTDSYHGVVLVNTFGVRMRASSSSRLWAGPQLATALINSHMGLGVGLAAGSNYHVFDKTSIGITLEGRRMLYTTPMGSDEYENIGMLRFELLFRFTPDTF